MLSVETLRRTTKLSDAFAWLITMLKSVGFETDGWQPGRIQRSLMTTFAAANADIGEMVRFVAEFGYGPTSRGPALTLFSRSRYRNERILARKTAGPMRLRNVSSSTYTIEVGRVIATDANGRQFRNSTPGTLLPGTTGAPSKLDLVFEAVKAGANGNVGRGTVNRLVTQFAGVTISNDVTALDQTWYTTTGLDEELDTALDRRNETKWALQSLDLVKEGFEAVALQNGAIKVDIDDTNPRGQGTLDVYAAGASEPLGSLQMQALQLAFSKRVFHTQAEWLTDWTGNASLIQVKPAPTQEFELPGSTVYYSGDLATTRARVQLALRDLLILAPIGGYKYPPGPTNVISHGDISAALEGCDGVKTIELALEGDFVVASRHLVVAPADPDFGLTYVAVTG